MTNETIYQFATCSLCGLTDCDCDQQVLSHSVNDKFNNEIMSVYDADDGGIDFYVNGVMLTTWVCEDDPEVTFNEFMLIWNKAQESINKGL